MNLAKAEQAMINGVYGAIAWLMLDFGLLLREHGEQTMSVLVSQPEMALGAVIVLICIGGLFYKSRFAASVLFLMFLVPWILRMVQGVFPSTMLFLFSLMLLYFFLTSVLGSFSYHQLKRQAQQKELEEE